MKTFFKNFFRISAAGFLVLMLCGAGLHPNAEELLTLKDQGDEEAAKEKETVLHDQVFQNVRKAIVSGQIKKGMKGADIRKKYGAPLAAGESPDGPKWLYKARGQKKWLEVPRVWLYFDKKEILTDWECAYADCGG